MAARNDIDRHLAKEALLPVYAFVGSESVLVSEALASLRAKVLTRAADFNRHELTAREATAEQVMEAAGTMPMMADKRFVHVSEVHHLKVKDQQTLLAYLERPSPHTVLCFSGEKVDGRTKFGLALAKSGGLFAFEPPRQQELTPFIEQRARKRGYAIDGDAAQLLADLVGAEVGNLDRALEKLALHAGEGNTITSEDVESCVAPTRVHSIFELTDAIGQRDLGRASRLLRNALSGGESALGVLGMITRQLRQILQVKSLKAQGVGSGEIASRVGVRPFLVDSLVSQAKRYSEAELYRALDAALRADIRLKSSKLDPGVALDRLLVETLGAQKSDASPR